MAEDNHDRRAASDAGTTVTRSKIRGLVALPPLPRRSQELLQLAELVEQTPALAARILGVANSAFFRTQVPVKHITDATIRILGLNLVRDLSVSFVLNQPFDLQGCRRFDPIRFWIRSMGSAVLVQLLLRHLPQRNPPTPSTAYLAGLLHNLGLLVLVHVAPEAMDGVFGELERHPEASLLAVERQLLGLDHAVAGAELASAWKLPSALAAAMGPAGEPSGRDELTTLVSLVLLCRCINRVLDDGDDIGQDPELDRTLTALDIRFDGWPALLSEWRERTENIEGLAAAFAGPGR